MTFPTRTARHQRATTSTGTVYEFIWDSTVITSGPRTGKVRRDGGPWGPCYLHSGYVADGLKLAYTNGADYWTHTSRVMKVEDLDGQAQP